MSRRPSPSPAGRSSTRFHDDDDHTSRTSSPSARLMRSLTDLADGTSAALRNPHQQRHSPWRHTLGIVFLLVTVVLWTASSFLASTIFADNSYSKPYFVTYINAAFFTIPLVPMLAKRAREEPGQVRECLVAARNQLRQLRTVDAGTERTPFLAPAEEGPEGEGVNKVVAGGSVDDQPDAPLSLLETTKISFEFCFLWFLANYFNVACLEYTTVASSTILSSTSSIWTLLCGSFMGVEKFTLKKLVGVLASLLGVILISMVDVSGESNKDRGSFPYKSPKEVAIGDVMAFISALMYGIYAVMMKKRIGDEGRVNMPLFFGIVGFFNVVLFWPGIPIVHAVGAEPFELPPTGRILMIVLVNSTSSLVSDFCWAYAMLLTSPLVVTVGLSLTIPLSLIGQMILDAQYSSVMYWFGAAIVFLSFIFINHQEKRDEEPPREVEDVPLMAEEE